MIDFVLVPDGLSGNFVRSELAKYSLNGVKVGNFSTLLETLQSLWLLQETNSDWAEKLQSNALLMPTAFWAKSIKVDEVSVINQLDQSLRHILKTLPLHESLSLLDDPQTKAERYFNDLVGLHQKMQRIRPTDQQTAKLWLTQLHGLSLEGLNLYFDPTLFHFDVWQQEVIAALVPKQVQSLNHDVITDLLNRLSDEVASDFTNLKNILFTNQSAVNLPEGLKGLMSRDAIEGCDVVASMIQKSTALGVSPKDIAVVYPAGSNYPIWLGKVFEQAGILVSNLPAYQAVFDWQTALLRDLVVLQSESTPPMAWMSVLSNPLMPWRNHKKRISIIEGKIHKVREVADEVADGLIDLLAQKMESSEETIEWLKAVMEYLKPLSEQGLTSERMNEKLSQLGVWFELYENDAFEEQCQKILNQLQPYSLNMAGEKNHYLNSVTALASNETLLRPVKHLFVLGFNQGNYTFNASNQSDKTVLNNQAWSLLSKQSGLALDTFDSEVLFAQTHLKALLGKAVESLTILTAQQDFNGGRLHLSETALDLALCFMPAEKVNPGLLFSALTDSDHPLLHFSEIKTQQQAPLVLEELKLEQDLLALHTVDDGSQRPESPSSFETMIVSPLAWLLDRQGLKDKGWEVQGLDVMLQGTVAHKVFELYPKHQTETLTVALYEQLFFQAVKQDAAFLLEPQWRLELVQLKQQVKPAFDKFAIWLAQTGWTIHKDDVEKKLSGELWNIPVKGFADAVLKKGDKVLVLDYKKSQSKDRIKRLSHGFDLQTYIYRELYQQECGETEIHSGYYNLNDQVMVLDQLLDAEEGIKVVAPNISVDEQSIQARVLVESRLSQLRQGKVELNFTQDQSKWEKDGIKAYALKNNPVVIRFMKEQEEEL